MPPWVVPNAGRLAGDTPPKLQGDLGYLSETRNAYILQQEGTGSLSELVAPPYQAGLGVDTEQGDYLTASVAAGNPTDGIYYQDVVLVDTAGQGKGSLQTVGRITTYGRVEEAGGEVRRQAEAPQDASNVQQRSTDIDPQQGQGTTDQQIDPNTGYTQTTTQYAPDPTVDDDDDLNTGNLSSAGNAGEP